MKYIFITLFLILSVNFQIFSQEHNFDNNDTLGFEVVTPNPDFKAGRFHQWFFGEHWRDIWSTPITVPVFNFRDKYTITDTSASSGKQTLSFEFTEGSNIYKFRSVRKFSKSIDPELYESFAGRVIEDQLSTKHPFAPIVAYPLLKAANVMMPEPYIFVMNRSVPLRDFSGMLGTLQLQPKDEFLHLKDISKTEKILEKMNDDASHQVDAAEFLKARLVDILIGDWDRHHGQWKWGRTENNNLKLWVPISMDRDEAFARYDGLFPWLYALAVPRYEGFSEDYPQVDDLTWEGRYVDRRFLTSLSKEAWDTVTNYVKNAITDDVIRASINKMPAEWVKLKGDFMINALKTRRDNLKEMSDNYYHLMFKQPDVWASNQDETALIEFLDKNRLKLTIHKKGTDMQKELPLFSRVFDRATTHEVRLYMQGGNDDVIITGPSSDEITLRIVGGDGKDRIIENAKGDDFDIIYYDSDNNTSVESDYIFWVDEKWKMPKDVIDRINPTPQDYDIDWKVKPWLAYSSDDGLMIGAGPQFTRYGFRYKPFKYRLRLLGGYATGSKAYHIKSENHFYNVFRNINTQLNGYSSTLIYTHFYGMGNETTYDENLYDNDYYRVEHSLNRVEFVLSKDFTKLLNGSAGLSFTYFNTKDKPGTVVDDLNPAGLGKYNFYGLKGSLLYEGEDPDFKPMKGTRMELTAEYFPNVFHKEFNYTKLLFSVRKLFLQNFMKQSFFIVTGHAEKIFGDFPFFEAAHLGGSTTLRGYNRDRFSGDAALSGGLEMNMYIARLKMIFPADFGITLFSDAGKVFVQGENSKKIHYSVGGGIWLSYFSNILTFQFTTARTTEGQKFYIDTGFGF